MESKLYLYLVWVRLWHWSNGLFFLLLLFSGISLQYSSEKFALIRFDIAVSMHNISGVILSIAYVVFILGNIFTANGKYYKIPKRGFPMELFNQIKYYTVGIFTKKKSPYPINIDRKFNPLQKLSYVGAMYILMPILIASGFGLIFPEILIHKIFGMSGLHLTGLVHIIAGFGLSVFMLIHIYFCTIGKTPTSNFKSMINGWH
ncbi:MAG: cytochrome b/b6 domain-containing protein [Bacteroidales bacterium]|nr:cytochrome b/b6 domain-containing protein [Bacteroidales bacterium]